MFAWGTVTTTWPGVWARATDTAARTAVAATATKRGRPGPDTPVTLLRKLKRPLRRNQAAFERLAEEPLEHRPPAHPEIERELVHVHADKRVGLVAVETPVKLQRVLHRLAGVGQPVGDAVMEQAGDAANQIAAQIAPDDVAAKRQRQAARALEPPLAEIHDLAQPLGLIGELP